MKYNLDSLKKVELRDVWPHEALDFTKWLSEEPNLAMLSSAIAIELELIETESSVGSFNLDIYAQESGMGRKVIVEDQLEDTNHDHLGKVITYAAGKGAEVVVWVVARARDEHRQAIEWLNQHTDNDFGFFLVEIELWSIGDSLPAPRFNVVEQHRAVFAHDHHRDDVEANGGVGHVVARHVGDGDPLEPVALRLGVRHPREAGVGACAGVHLEEDDGRFVAGHDVGAAGLAFPVGVEDLVALALEEQLGCLDCLAVEFFCVHG